MPKSKVLSTLLPLLLFTTVVALDSSGQTGPVPFSLYTDTNPMPVGSKLATLALWTISEDKDKDNGHGNDNGHGKDKDNGHGNDKDNGHGNDKCKDKDKDKDKGKDKDKDKDKCKEPENRAPTVNAGANQTVTPPNAVILNGTASDDGLPAGSTVTTTWSKLSGPGTVSFINANAFTTTASFSSPGAYVLRLTATDGSLNATDDVRITVNPAVYYVNAANGNDANPGTSLEPLKTIQQAANTLEAGASLIVNSGVYDERVQITRSGRPGSPITYRTEGTVIMRGFTINASYIKVKGFEITNSRINFPDSTGVYIYGAQNEVSNCYIHDIAGDSGVVVFGGSDANGAATNNNLVKNNRIVRARTAGLRVEGQNNVIEGNDISHTLQNPPGAPPIVGADADGIRFFGSGHVIRKNYIHDIHLTDVGNHACFEGGVNCPHIDAFQTWGPASNIIIEDNVIQSTDDGLSGRVPLVNPQWAQIEANPGTIVTNLLFRNNVFTHETTKFGPMNLADGAGGSLSNITIVNNTFVRLNGPGSGGPLAEVAILVDGSLGLLTNVRIQNNAFYDCGSSTAGYVGVRGLTANIGYNSVFVSSGPAPAGGPSPNDLWLVDPKFVNFAARDFHLQASSPLIDAGVTIPEVTDDLDGTPRPQGHGYDIGAFEFRRRR